MERRAGGETTDHARRTRTVAKRGRSPNQEGKMDLFVTKSTSLMKEKMQIIDLKKIE